MAEQRLPERQVRRRRRRNEDSGCSEERRAAAERMREETRNQARLADYAFTYMARHEPEQLRQIGLMALYGFVANHVDIEKYALLSGMNENPDYMAQVRALALAKREAEVAREVAEVRRDAGLEDPRAGGGGRDRQFGREMGATLIRQRLQETERDAALRQLLEPLLPVIAAAAQGFADRMGAGLPAPAGDSAGQQPGAPGTPAATVPPGVQGRHQEAQPAPPAPPAGPAAGPEPVRHEVTGADCGRV